MNISNNQFLSIEQLQEQYLKQQKKIQPEHVRIIEV